MVSSVVPSVVGEIELPLPLPTSMGGTGAITPAAALAALGGGTVQFSKLVSLATAAATTLTLPANAFIHQIIFKNNTANAVTGGVKIGTTLGGVDVVLAQAVGASAVFGTLDAALLKRFFSTSATQTLFIDTVTLWNSASVDITVVYGRL